MPALKSIDGRYEILELLGEGLSGEVFLVAAASQRYALKLLKPMSDRRLHESLLKAFKFEFAFLKDLRHPNVVRIHDFGFDAATERFYFTEEFLLSRGAADYAAKADARLVGELFVQAIQGLQAIHRAKLRHGDLKASNLLVVEEQGQPLLKIIDLGLADPRFPFTAGTPSTMAPEQILREPVDERADLYSLGVVFYQLFSGQNPFARADAEATYRAHLTLKPPPLSLANPAVPAFWNSVFQTLLEKNPARRFRDAGDLLAAVEFAQPGKSRGPKPWRPERWFARADLIDGALAKLRSALSAKGGKPRALLLSGEAGAGKSRLAQELKYCLQMESVRVLPAFEAGAELWLLDEWPAEEKEQELCWERLQAAAKPAPLLATVERSREESLKLGLEARGFEVLSFPVPAFSREELKVFLQELSGVAEIPEAFLAGLWRKTEGNPGLVVAAVEAFSRRQRLLDAQGRWNLVAFREGDLDFEEKDWSLEELDKALAALPQSEAAARATLKLRRADEQMARAGDAEVESAFAEAEAEISALSAGADRLRLKAACEERRGVFELKRGRTQAAKLRFERASALLEESGADAALWIRCRNYLAGLMAQEGAGREAVKVFQEMEGKWSDLAADQQARVLNQDLGSALLQVGEAQSAVAAWQRLLPVYERIGDPPSLMRAYYNLAEAQLAARDFEAAVAGFERGAELMRLHRQFDFLLRTYNGLGKVRHLMGQAEAAKNDYRTGLELAEYLGDSCSAAALAQNLGSILGEGGDFEAARRHFNLAINFLGKLSERHPYAQYLLARAWIELADLERRQGHFDQALAFARDADRLAQQEASLAGFRFWVLLTRAEIARDRGREGELEEALAELLPMADDAEKKAKVEALRAKDSVSTSPTEGSTRVETIRPDPMAPGESLVLAERRLAAERDPETLRRLVQELERRLRESEEELERARREGVESSVLLRFAEADFLSRNAAMQDLFRTVERIRDTELAVVIHGESGTGKELLARSLHRGSRRHTGPFVAVNCAAFPAALIESELFGYRAGAFTGAVRDKPGLIESAEGGTLFLDEIAELELSLQAKLLRVLQEREIVRIGETKPRPVRFRLLSASHRKLEEQVRVGRFREDLFYRVAELELDLPPLRERPEDIAPLAERFIVQYLEEHREKEKVKLGRDLLGALLEYPWPGNVRELENLIRAATALRRGPQLRLQDLPASWRERLKGKGEIKTPVKIVSPTSTGEAKEPKPKSWRELEELILAKALLHFDLDVRQAALALGCAPSKLYQRLRESRLAERRNLWAAEPYHYRGESLAELKRRAFQEALAEAGGSAYRAARRLGVSPATVYQWAR